MRQVIKDLFRRFAPGHFQHMQPLSLMGMCLETMKNVWRRFLRPFSKKDLTKLLLFCYILLH